MKVMKGAAGLAVAAALSVGGVMATSSPASADSVIQCVPYTETTGSCLQRNDDGTTILFFYWGNYWVEYQLQ